MKILITGGAGFVGSHLADRLIADGHEITVIDDLSTGRYSNVEHLEGNEKGQNQNNLTLSFEEARRSHN